MPAGRQRSQGTSTAVTDEGSYDLRELASRKNLAAVLFWLEKTPDPADLRRGVRRLMKLLSGPDDGELRSAFASWLQLVKLPGQGLTEEDIPEVLGLEEFRNMLEARVKEWNKILLEKGRKSGLQEGRREGEQKGEQRGEAKLLLRQLERKFGRVAPPVRKRVMAADPDRLLEWGERVLVAARLEEVFGEA